MKKIIRIMNVEQNIKSILIFYLSFDALDQTLAKIPYGKREKMATYLK